MPTLADARQAAKLALESLIHNCQEELRNLERFEDGRMLIATADVQDSFNSMLERADELEQAFSAAQDEVTE